MVKIGPAFLDSISEQRLNKKHERERLVSSGLSAVAPLFFLLLFFAIIIARLFYLQVLRSSYYKNLSEQNRTQTEIIEAPRGIIFDRENHPLVSNSPAFKIVEAGRTRQLSRDEALRLIARGLPVKNDVEREYLYKDAFAHVIGYIGRISKDEIILPEFENYAPSEPVGKSGLEREYEKILHGENGKRLFEVDSKGTKIRELGTTMASAGQNIKTTLDRNIGISVAHAAKGVTRGAIVVSDPRDGSILALYSAPSFDPNIFTSSLRSSVQAHGSSFQEEYNSVESILNDTDRQPLLNRTISGAYPPGSTFKLIAATAALEKGSLAQDTQIEDTGILRVGSFSFGNWYFLQYGRTEGNLNIVGAIKRSNDIFFYKTAERTGIDTISTWAKKFGLGSKLEIDLPNELAGTVPTVEWKEKTIGEQWYLGDTYNYGIGQGYLLATPLQVNMMTTVFANGGTLYEPHLMQSQKSKVKSQNFIDRKNIDLVREGMAETCDTGGVAWPLFQFRVKNSRLKIDDRDYFRDASSSADMVRVKLACKTGTAEAGGNTNPHAWITVFAPFYKPEIALTVLVENGGEGSSVAGPIAKEILTDYFEKK